MNVIHYGWVRARDLGLHSISGYFDGGSTGSNQAGIGGMTAA